jgi:hypothetical protein
MLDLPLIIWCIPVAVALAVAVILAKANKPKEDGTVCPRCGDRFYTKHVVDNVVMYPCGHKFERINEEVSASTGPR